VEVEDLPNSQTKLQALAEQDPPEEAQNVAEPQDVKEVDLN